MNENYLRNKNKVKPEDSARNIRYGTDPFRLEPKNIWPHFHAQDFCIFYDQFIFSISRNIYSIESRIYKHYVKTLPNLNFSKIYMGGISETRSPFSMFNPSIGDFRDIHGRVG